ncbi:50S ribosomal protein L24 [Patescibacteria group bacterium]|nr:50S ribosomal protein L24 [Patescibacteria group bacterium]
MARIRKDDLVKVVAGDHKGTTGKVVAVVPSKNVALVEGIGIGRRHVKPSQLNPRGGKKDIHVGVSLHKLALVVDEKSTTTSRIGYKKTETGKMRVARQLKNKEIK